MGTAVARGHPFRVTTGTLEFRRLDEADIDRMVEIERDGYRYPWNVARFDDCMGPDYDAWGCFLEDQLLGYLIHWQVPGLHEAHLMNLCVHARYLRQGVGRHLLRHWIARMVSQGMSELSLEVRSSNGAARALYESEGFEAQGERPDYYQAPEGPEAALIMKLDL